MTIELHQQQVGTLDAKIHYAQTLAAANLIPQAYRNRPADVLVAVEYGEALGIKPIVALSEINVINGSPSLSASLMGSLARQAGHKVRVTSDATSATCIIVRADDPDFQHEVTWDEARARKTGLWGKGHWAKDPQVMLEWRALAACVRKACPEVLAGLRYTPEEVSEFTGPEQPQATPATTVRQVSTAPTGPASLADVVDAEDEWQPKIDALDTVDAARALWSDAKHAQAPGWVLAAITAKATDLGTNQQTGEVPDADEVLEGEFVSSEYATSEDPWAQEAEK